MRLTLDDGFLLKRMIKAEGDFMARAVYEDGKNEKSSTKKVYLQEIKRPGLDTTGLAQAP